MPQTYEQRRLSWGSAIVIVLVIITVAVGLYSMMASDDHGWRAPARTAESLDGAAAISENAAEAADVANDAVVGSTETE